MNAEDTSLNPPLANPPPEPSSSTDELYGPEVWSRFLRLVEGPEEVGLTERNIQKALFRHHADVNPVPSFNAYKRRMAAAAKKPPDPPAPPPAVPEPNG